jgi:hypothetical protein
VFGRFKRAGITNLGYFSIILRHENNFPNQHQYKPFATPITPPILNLISHDF